jgi:hypothetical protein
MLSKVPVVKSATLLYDLDRAPDASNYLLSINTVII